LRDDLISQIALAFQKCVREMAYLVLTNHSLLDALRAPDVLDVCDLEGTEHESVQILRSLLPAITGPEYTVKWCWQPGDIVAWDNRCTIHSATGYDYERYSREMWRLTLLDRAQAQRAAG
jgi:alpha-ketoglutarate-dependent taurine dioxygenase